MQVINWLELQPLLGDVDSLNARLREAQPVRIVCRFLVEITLHGYPWSGRSDLIPCYHPSRTYKPGQWIGLPVPDPKNTRPTAWQVARVKAAESTGNSIQGRFQALVLDVGGKEVQRTAGLPDADYPVPGLESCTPEDLHRLGDWVTDVYAGALLSSLRKLIQKGRIFGQLSGETFLPEQMFALSVERLEPFFARLSPALRWVSLEEILQGLPDLAHLKRETALALVRSTLKVSPYCSLGGDRWTTPDLFEQLDREVPCGLPAAGIRSRLPLWTGLDRKDLAMYWTKPIPDVAVCALEELGMDGNRSEPDLSAWQPPEAPLQLPALSTHDLTHACFPVGHILQAFAPEARMVFVQFVEGEHQPFILDRGQGLLKAVHPEALQARILESGLPAGVHLRLTCQGSEAYRIHPQPLAQPRMVPCKRAWLQEGKLHIEPSQIQMSHECDGSVFQVDMLLEDIQALHTGARSSGLSVREALVSAVQALCAAGSRKVASRADIFDAVFLQRSCSARAAAVLLYTLPCFEQLQGGEFRYRPMLNPPAVNIWKQANRVSRLWEDLAADRVAPDPAGKRQSFPVADPDMEQPVSLEPAPERVHHAHTDVSGMVAGTSIRPSFATIDAGGGTGEETFMERVSLEPVRLIRHALEALTAPPAQEPATLQEPEDNLEIPPLGNAELEQTAGPLAIQAGFAHYPAMVRVPMEPDPQPGSSIDTRRVAYGLKVPARPLHKRPIYQRLFFCLRGWLHIGSRRKYDPYS